MDLKLSHTPPSAQELKDLRTKIDWLNPSIEIIQKSLDNSLFIVCIRHESKLIGFGRVIGDNAMYFYIQDVIVDPDYQNKGVGKMLMNELEEFLSKSAMSGATIGLLAATGKEGFYESFGYSARTGNPLGLGMCKFID